MVKNDCLRGPMAGIFYVDYYIPDTFIPIEDVVKNQKNYWLPDESNSIDDVCKYLREKEGFDKIAVADKMVTVEIFSKLLSDFLRNRNVDPLDISYIIVSGPESYISDDGVNIPYYLRQEYGLENASIFSLQAGCAASLVSTVLASGILSLNNKGKYAVILSCSYIEKNEYRYFSHTVIGDGAGIMVISRESADYDIISFDSVTDGLGSYNQHHKTGISNKTTIPYNGMKSIRNFLITNRLRPTDIYMMIPQNVSPAILKNVYLKYMNFPVDRCFLKNVPNGGHLGDVDIIRNLKDFTNMYLPPIGAYVLLFGIGIILRSLRRRVTYNNDEIWEVVLLRCNKD